MRVLNVISSLRNAAGTSVFVAELADALVDLGVDVTIAVRPLIGIDSLVPQKVPHSLNLFEVIKAKPDCDILHLHGLWQPCLHKTARWAFANNLPVVWSPHGMMTSWTLRHKFVKKMLGLIAYQWWDLRKASLLHATAQSEVADIRRLYLKNPVVVAPLGVKLPTLKPRMRMPNRIRTLLFVSRVQKKKGLPNLIRAWALVPHAGWRVVVAGPDQEGHAEEVQALARKLGVEADFQFIGSVFGKEKDRLYNQADLFVLPTHSENFGVVVLEALAAGVPVITTKGAPWSELQGEGSNAAGAAGSKGVQTACRPGSNAAGAAGSKGVQTACRPGSNAAGAVGSKEGSNGLSASFILHPSSVADNGRCGWWIDIGAEPLAEALKEAMELSDEERRAMGENGRRLVEAKYTWPAIAEQMKAAYAWILDGGEKPDCVVL